IDGGQSWTSNAVPLSVVGGCAFYLQGIGFADETNGWMGGASCSPDLDSFIQTTNGGVSWSAAGYTPTTTFINRIRFKAPDWGFASGYRLHLFHSPLSITNHPQNQY